jgi:hypothetical protein
MADLMQFLVCIKLFNVAFNVKTGCIKFFYAEKSLFNAAGNVAWFNIYAAKSFFKAQGMKQFMQRVMKQAMNRGLNRRKMLLFLLI